LTLYPEARIGGYTRTDGTTEFYTRERQLLASEMKIDLGSWCRAGEWVEDSCTHRRRLRFLRGDVAWVVGADPAPAVRRNPAVDESIVLPEGLSLPFPAAQFDIVI